LGATSYSLWRILRNLTWDTGETILLGWRSTLWITRVIRQRTEIINQTYICSIKSLAVVSIVGAFTGMALSLQTGSSLAIFGQEQLVGGVVAVALAREMGPNMTAFILAGLVGSAMAAEIGTMKVSDEIDALEVMSIDPVRYLVMPRLLALSFAAPLLTVYNDFLGYICGGLVADTQLGVDWDTYTHWAKKMIYNGDVLSGLFKAWIFGITIAMISCAEGLRTSGGARGVGRATRSAVVQCTLAIIVFNYFLTSFFTRWVY
jgi:phospholipid/cholesterol/gamma-HCH transport system permease protein